MPLVPLRVGSLVRKNPAASFLIDTRVFGDVIPSFLSL